MALRFLHLHPRHGGVNPTPTAFVLGGGGNLGAIQVGMLRALLERGITPDVLVGCSVGAINAAALALDPSVEGVRRLEAVWLELGPDVLGSGGRLNSVRMLTHRGTSVASSHGIRALLESQLGVERFEDLALPLHVVAASLRTGAERWFSSGPLIDAIMASAALPAILPPVAIDGDLLIDGAVVNNVPISRAIDIGAHKVVVLHVGNFDRPRPLPRRPIDVLVQAFSIARNHRFLAETQESETDAEITVLPGIDPGGLRYDDFTRSRQLIERGYASTAAFLDTTQAAASN